MLTHSIKPWSTELKREPTFKITLQESLFGSLFFLSARNNQSRKNLLIVTFWGRNSFTKSNLPSCFFMTILLHTDMKP